MYLSTVVYQVDIVSFTYFTKKLLTSIVKDDTVHFVSLCCNCDIILTLITASFNAAKDTSQTSPDSPIQGDLGIISKKQNTTTINGGLKLLLAYFVYIILTS